MTEIYGYEQNTQIAKRELVSILTIGLRYKRTAKKVLLEHPNNFRDVMDAAILLEKKDQNLAAHGLKHEALEVDEVKRSNLSRTQKFGQPMKKAGTSSLSFRRGKLGHIKAQCGVCQS